MPNRILHESIKYCPKMEQLNWFEEVVYHRLTVSVDDYGCLDGRIVLLKNTLFPTREDIAKDDIARAIEHMVALGLLRAYEAGGMPYLHFPAWEEEQRVRNKRRKFPAPPDEEEPLAAEDSLSAADGGALFAGEKHLTASCCQLTAGCPPESNPYPYPYPNPDSNPKFESGSVTNPYPIQAPGACAEERPRAGEQSLRHSLRCDTVPQFSMGASLRSQSSLERLPASLGLLRPASATGGGLRAPLFAKREAIDGAIPEDGVRPLAGKARGPLPRCLLRARGKRRGRTVNPSVTACAVTPPFLRKGRRLMGPFQRIARVPPSAFPALKSRRRTPRRRSITPIWCAYRSISRGRTQPPPRRERGRRPTLRRAPYRRSCGRRWNGSAPKRRRGGRGSARKAKRAIEKRLPPGSAMQALRKRSAARSFKTPARNACRARAARHR